MIDKYIPLASSLQQTTAYNVRADQRSIRHVVPPRPGANQVVTDPTGASTTCADLAASAWSCYARSTQAIDPTCERISMHTRRVCGTSVVVPILSDGVYK